MTELPPRGDRPGDDELEDPWHDQLVEVSDDYGAPEVLAVVAFVLSLVSLSGFGLLNGSYYFLPYINSAEGQKTRLVLAALLGALLALLPVWLGWRASARVLATDARWVATLARAAVMLGLLSLVLRLVLSVVTAAATDPSSIGRL
ncbi:MAG: hypothetical protein JWP11_1082 [Frankiales bacterium]|nr:hypothetical protein [Frankiales bacterium]